MQRNIDTTLELSKDARRFLEIARDPARAFTELHEMALMDTIEAHQRRYEARQQTQAELDPTMSDSPSSAPALMPKESVLACLEALGWREGYDEAASAFFFGPLGLDEYTDGHGQHARTTLGGFVFDAPDGDRYVVTGVVRPDLPPELQEVKPRPLSPIGSSLARRLLSVGQHRHTTSPLIWNLEKAGLYTVQPCCLYEDLTIEDLASGGFRPCAGLPAHADSEAGGRCRASVGFDE